MQDKRSSAALPTLMAFIMLALLLSAYAAGYFLMSTRMAFGDAVDSTWVDEPNGSYRWFHHAWLVTLYQPAAIVESRLRGVPVHVTAGDERKRKAFISHESVD